jgi:hypothetical protein
MFYICGELAGTRRAANLLFVTDCHQELEHAVIYGECSRANSLQQHRKAGRSP